MFSNVLRTTVLVEEESQSGIHAEKSHSRPVAFGRETQVAAAVPELVVGVCICSPGKVQQALFNSASSARLHMGDCEGHPLKFAKSRLERWLS